MNFKKTYLKSQQQKDVDAELQYEKLNNLLHISVGLCL